MDIFKTFSWNIPVELETDFASAEEFKSSSITYKILHGTFQSELSSDSSDDPASPEQKIKRTARKKKKGKKKNSKKVDDGENVEKKNEISGDDVQRSVLTASQHASYVRMMCAAQSQRINILPELMKMKEAVEIEQADFLEHLRELWMTAHEKHYILSDVARRFTEDIWKSQLKRVKLYPKCYTHLKRIPLVYPADYPEVQMVPMEVLLEMGVVPKLILPQENTLHKISPDYSTMLLLNAPSSDDSRTLAQVSVSCDKNAEILALKEKADIVISSSGLKCLADNLCVKYDKVWNVPVVVKQYNIKDGDISKPHKVVYVDKKFPAKSMSYSERNTWFHKLAVKCLMCNHRDSTAFRYPENCGNSLEVNFTNYELLKPLNNIEEPRVDGLCCNCKLPKQKLKGKKITQISTLHHSSAEVDDAAAAAAADDDDDDDDGNDNKSSHSDDLVMDVDDEPSASQMCSCETTSREKDGTNTLSNADYTVIPPPSKTNVTYRLWKLSCEERSKEELNEKFLKGQSSHKEIRVLVRCKIDACERDDHHVLPLCVSCKMEYQAEYGAEKLNISSLVKEWTTLFFRPEAMLKRIRIDALRDEVLMTEKLTTRDVAQIATHVYNLRLRKSVLGSLYQVMMDLIGLTPGHYLLSHSSRCGPFITLLQTCDIKNSTYDLHADYESVDPSVIPSDALQWSPIDTSLITPKHVSAKVIPATYPPAM